MTALVTAAQAQETASGPGSITDISVLPSPTAATVVQVTATAGLAEQDFDLALVSGGAPRALLKLRGIAYPYAPARFEVGDDNLLRVRTGFHPEHAPPQLHVVFDLAADEVVILSTRIDAGRLLISFGRPGADRAVAPTPSPRPTAAPPPPTPRPTARPTRPPTPLPSPTPRAIPSPTPTPVPRPVSTPVATPIPTPSTQAVGSTELIYRADDAAVAAAEDPSVPLRRRVASIITEIVVSHRQDDGSTLVRLTANAPFAQRLFRHEPPDPDRSFPNEPPLHRLYLSGISIPGAPREVIPVHGPAVEGIEIISGDTQDDEEQETQVALYLASPEVRITRVASSGPHLVLGFGVSTPAPDEDVFGMTMTTPTAVATAPTATPPPEQVPGVGTTIRDLTVVRQSDGATVVRVAADGVISSDRYQYSTVSDNPPRGILAIQGVTSVQGNRVIPVNGPCLRRVQVLERQGDSNDSLHLVFDLSSSGVKVTYVTNIDQYVLVRLIPPAWQPAAAASPPPIPTVSPTTAVQQAEIATAINEIGYWHRGDGTTVVMIAANGPIPEGSYRQTAAGGLELVLTLTGIEQTYQPSLIEINDARVRSVHIVHRADRTPAELELIFRLTSDQVRISQILRRQTTLLVHLE